MPQKIAIETDTLRNQADQLESCALELDDDLNKATQQIFIINESTSFSMRMAMAAQTVMLQKMVKSLMDTIQTGVSLARQCADEFQNTDVGNKRNIDQMIRDNIVDLPPRVTETSVSTQGVIDERLYDQYLPEYMEGENSFDYDHDGDSDGCAICSAAYALTSMGIYTTPRDAYNRSGGVGATWNAIANGQATYQSTGDVSKTNFDLLAKASFQDGNMSDIIIHTNEFGTHYVVLKDIKMDNDGNITQYTIYDPNGYNSYQDYTRNPANGYQYNQSLHIKTYSSFDELVSKNKGLDYLAYYTRN